MKTIIGIFAVLLILILAVTISKNVFKRNLIPGLPTGNPTATINGHKISLTVVKTEQDREIGLSKVDSLPDDKGMLFVFDKPGIYPFWMRNMKFPIDIIFLNKNHVITIYQNVPNPTIATDNLPIYKPESLVDMVLEIKAGTANKYNVKKGDTIDINNL